MWIGIFKPYTQNITRVSAAADRPARRRGSAHAKYSISHHMVIKPFVLLGWIQISTVGVINSCRRPSEVYDTHQRTKLTVPETISRSRDMIGAHQHLNGSRDLTMPLSGIVSLAACHPWASACYCYLPTISLQRRKVQWSNFVHKFQHTDDKSPLNWAWSRSRYSYLRARR